ncbi:MAG: hypothetical protein WEE64_14425 [Dehalococcoidia bacterium]
MPQDEPQSEPPMSSNPMTRRLLAGALAALLVGVPTIGVLAASDPAGVRSSVGDMVRPKQDDDHDDFDDLGIDPTPDGDGSLSPPAGVDPTATMTTKPTDVVTAEPPATDVPDGTATPPPNDDSPDSPDSVDGDDSPDSPDSADGPDSPDEDNSGSGNADDGDDDDDHSGPGDNSGPGNDHDDGDDDDHDDENAD